MFEDMVCESLGPFDAGAPPRSFRVALPPTSDTHHSSFSLSTPFSGWYLERSAAWTNRSILLNYCLSVSAKLASSETTPLPDPAELPRPGRVQGVETDEGARLPGRRDLERSEGDVLVRLSLFGFTTFPPPHSSAQRTIPLPFPFPLCLNCSLTLTMTIMVR